MELTSFYEDLLGLDERWKLTDVLYSVESEEVRIYVEDTAEARFPCPSCGKSCRVYDHQEERVWRHLDTMQMQTYLHARVPRIKCDIDGVKVIKLPWAEKHSQFTVLFERFAIDLLLQTSIAKACKLLRISWDEGDGIMTRAVKRGLARKSQRVIRHMAIDETSSAKGLKYLTIVSSGDGAVEYVGDGRRKESLDAYFQGLDVEIRRSVEAITMDMWHPYLASVRDYIPLADEKIVLDKYHIMAHLNHAVDLIRRQENAILRKKNCDTLKNTKYLWLYNPDNMPMQKRELFEKIKKKELRVCRAWAIKESFRSFWDFEDEKVATEFFSRWYSWASHSKFYPMAKVAKMLKRHFAQIVTYCRMRVTNAIAESINAKIQKLKKAAHGFRNFERFRYAIYFHYGKLDLYPL